MVLNRKRPRHAEPGSPPEPTAGRNPQNTV